MHTAIDVRRYSDVLIKKLGRRAPQHAAIRAELLLEAGEFDRYAVWKQIVQSVNERLAQARRERADRATSRMAAGAGRKEGGVCVPH
jgi:hypothetical protein